MSNHPDNLEIFDSAGPPAGMLTSKGGPSMVSVMQDISTFGIAGRIWDSSYVLDVFLQRPVPEYTFTPPCPIPTEYFLNTTTAAASSSIASESSGVQPTTPTLSPSSSTPSTSPSSSTPSASPSSSQALPPLRILEIGAGTGYVGIALAKRLGPEVTLILTDLEEVTPLLQKNVNDNLATQDTQEQEKESLLSSSSSSSSAAAATTTTTTGGARGTRHRHAILEVQPLAWGNSTHAQAILTPPPPPTTTTTTTTTHHDGKIDFVVASDLVYFPELYPPLLETLIEISEVGRTRVLFGYKERAIWKESPFWEQFGRFFEIEVVRIKKNKVPVVVVGTAESEKKEEEDEEEYENVLGAEDGMYVFVCTKRKEEDVLKGVDDTLATLMMMQIGI